METARIALGRVMDVEHAERIVSGLQSMKLSRCESAREDSKVRHYRDGSVGRHGKRYTARVRLDARVRVRGEEAPEVVGPVLLLLHILDHAQLHAHNQEWRAWTKALWLGKQHRGPDQQGQSLSRALGVSVRELQRWLAALRTLGALKNWQPPVDEKTPPHARTRKGRAYSCYLLGDMGATWSEYQRGLRTHASQKAATNESTPHAMMTSPGVQLLGSRGEAVSESIASKLASLIPAPS